MYDEENENYRELLEKNRVEIVQCLDLDRQYIFSHLRSKFVLDDEDCQIILNAGPSRQQKAQKFIDVLATKGPESYHHFIDALEIEHPHLYEIFTGNKPVSQPCNESFSRIMPWTALSDKQLLDFDREYLVKEFQKASETNQSLAYMHSKLLQEKRILELKYEEMLKELEERDCLIQDLQYEIDNKNDQSNVTDHAEQLNEFGLHCQRLMRDSVEKSNIIITLQSRLLAKNEEFETVKESNNKLQYKNTELMQQVRELTINYDWQRKQSNRLSKTVSDSRNLVKKHSAEKKELYEIKFQLSNVKEERDDALHQLEEFKSVTAALNTKHKMLQQERFTEEDQIEQISGEYQQLCNEIKVLENEIREEKIKSDALHRRNQRFQKEIETHKGQTDFYLHEFERVTTERDQITLERDDTRSLYEDLKKLREEAVQKQIAVSTMYEKQIADLIDELDRCQKEQDEYHINHVLEVNDIVNRELKMTSEIEKEVNNNNCDTTCKETNQEQEGTETTTEQDKDKLTAEEMRARWRNRTNTGILRSAYGILHDENKGREAKSRKGSVPNLNLKHKQMALVYGSLKNPKNSPVTDLLEAGGPFFMVKNVTEKVEKSNALSLQDELNQRKDTENLKSDRKYSYAGFYDMNVALEIKKSKEKSRRCSADLTTTHRRLSRT